LVGTGIELGGLGGPLAACGRSFTLYVSGRAGALARGAPARIGRPVLDARLELAAPRVSIVSTIGGSLS
jgi:hypothetical protein